MADVASVTGTYAGRIEASTGEDPGKSSLARKPNLFEPGLDTDGQASLDNEAAARKARGWRARWWVTFALILGLVETWSLATPLFGVPDEPAHVVKAAAAVRGDLAGKPTSNSTVRAMHVPAAYEAADAVPACFAFNSNRDASCAPDFDGRPGTKLVKTSAGIYPPFYYVIVGAPSLIVSGEAAVYLMRLVSGILVAALLASALASVGLLERPAPAVVAVAATVTPMVLFLGGSVNPSGLESAAGISLWASGLTMLSLPEHPQIRRVVWRFTVASCALILSRQLSPALFVMIAVFLLCYTNWATLRTLLTVRSVKWYAGVIASAFLVATGWILSLDAHLGLTTEQAQPGIRFARQVLGRQDYTFKQMIGIFGWQDTRAPALTYDVWIAVIGLLVFVAWAAGAKRRRWLVVTAGLVSVAVPFALEVKKANAIGIFWQGRYTLPFAAGVLIMAGFVIAGSQGAADLLQRASKPVFVALAIGSMLAYVQNCRRFAVGMAGHIVFLGSARWNPFLIPWALLIPLSLLLTVLAGVGLSRLILPKGALKTGGLGSTGSSTHLSHPE